MDLKIELIQDEMIPEQWHWFIMKWNGSTWYNAGCGLEASFGEAVIESKKEYDRRTQA